MIVRFSAQTAPLSELIRLGLSMNLLRPAVFTGLRKRGDGFSCEVSSDDDWATHLSEIQRFIREFAEVIAQALGADASVTVDVAVEPEDREQGHVLVLDWPPTVLSTIALAGVRLEVSVYQGSEPV